MDKPTLPRIELKAPFRRYEDFNKNTDIHISHHDWLDDPNYDPSNEPPMLDNEDLIIMLETTSKLKDLSKKINQMFGDTGPNFMFGKHCIIINGKEFEYGIELSDFSAQIVGEFLLEKFTNASFKEKKDSLETRLDAAGSIDEKHHRLTKELAHVTDKHERFKYMYKTGLGPASEPLTAYFTGFDSYARGGKPTFDKNLTEPKFEQTKEGITDAMIQAYLREMLKSFSVDNTEHSEVKRLLDSKFPKMRWTGATNQLYDVFRQLYDKEMLANTQDELADFIFEFVVFEKGYKPTVSSILRELKNAKKRPSKNKRIDLTSDEE